MKRFVYLVSLVVLGSGMMMAQTAKPESDSSNSSNPQAQTQSNANAATQTPDSNASKTGAANPERGTPDSNTALPGTTIQDEQRSTSDTTGAGGQHGNGAHSTMGTTGDTPATTEQNKQQRKEGTLPPDRNDNEPVDQQPNTSSSPHASLSAPNETELPRSSLNQAFTRDAAVISVPQRAPHSPDQGTMMNPEVKENESNLPVQPMLQ